MVRDVLLLVAVCLGCFAFVAILIWVLCMMVAEQRAPRIALKEGVSKEEMLEVLQMFVDSAGADPFERAMEMEDVALRRARDILDRSRGDR